MVNAINAGLPIFVSEYGTCDASGNGAIDEKQANAWVEEMDRYGVSYVAWNLSNKNETSALISSGCNKTSGFAWEDLSASGKWLFTVLTGESGFTGSVPAGTQGSPAQTPVTTPTPQQGNSDVVTDGAIEVTLELKDSWQSEGQTCYNYNVTLKNTSGSAMDGWSVDITLNENISLNQGWSGTYTVNGNVLQISPVSYNTRIEAGQSISDIGFIICGSQNLQVVK
jgi:endoglucanase